MSLLLIVVSIDDVKLFNELVLVSIAPNLVLLELVYEFNELVLVSIAFNLVFALELNVFSAPVAVCNVPNVMLFELV